MAMTRRVKQLLHRQPFKPFRIVMRSGDRHDVTNPDRVAIGKSFIYWFPPSDRMVQLAKSDIELVYEPRRSRE